MKHQFKFNPLATAIFTLLCGSSITSYAAIPTTSISDEQQSLKQALQESYPGQKFFEQYYVDKSSPEAQQRQGRYLSSTYCQGTWLTPVSPETKAADAANATSTITADYGHYNPQGDSVLEGNVLIDQEGRQIRADKITIDQTQTFANAEGRVQMAQSGLLAQSDQINYNLKTQQGDLKNSFYISEEQHAHGRADQILRESQTTTTLKNATYSTCPPEQSPTWKIQADEIKLNQETGRGETRGTKLYVKDVPVLAVPYFNFPIDDRRTTGILTPSFGFTNDGGVELAVPVYLNLAPNYVALSIVMWIALRPEILQDTSAGQFVAYITAAGMLSRPIKALTDVNEKIQRGMAAAHSVFEILDLPEEKNTGTLTPVLKGNIDFKDVNLVYVDGYQALHDFNLSVKEGETIALVGRSGAGKTSLVNLLVRFQDTTSGQILFDGIDIHDIEINSLRTQVAMVNQQVVLFNRTVRDNIAYGQLENASDEEVIAAAKAAYAHDFIMALPQGYNTKLGAQGLNLSGGQRQRIAIARAILKNAPVLILDEATSALDNESEYFIQRAFDAAMRDRTTIVIAHRLSTIENADRIVVMDKGRIVEQGTHAELIAKQGAYYQLHQRNFEEN
jgi:ABC-type multidrug transport system fused ATPase/permease subunit